MSKARPPAWTMTQEEIVTALEKMEADLSMNTVSSYSANSALYPDNTISFSDRHLAYLRAHPNLNPKHYLANLRLKLR